MAVADYVCTNKDNTIAPVVWLDLGNFSVTIDIEKFLNEIRLEKGKLVEHRNLGPPVIYQDSMGR